MNGPCRVPSDRAQNQVGSGGRAALASLPGSHASCGGSGASGTPASGGATTAGGGCGGDGIAGVADVADIWCGSSRATALGTLGPEPHAIADVKMQTTVWRRT